MTLPSRVFRNTKGFQAAADVSVNSPRQNNNQTSNQNINVYVSPLTKDREIKIETNEVELEDVKDDEQIELKNSFKQAQHDGLDIKERSIESAMQNLDEMNEIVKDKNCLIQALALIIDIYESNPLIINKFIVAEEKELARLITLLTGADEVEFIKKDDETGCTCKVKDYSVVQKIMIRKNDELINFKYSFPSCVRLLDNRHISYKIVC